MGGISTQDDRASSASLLDQNKFFKIRIEIRKIKAPVLVQSFIFYCFDLKRTKTRLISFVLYGYVVQYSTELREFIIIDSRFEEKNDRLLNLSCLEFTGPE